MNCETAHLLKSALNAQRLERSIDQLNRLYADTLKEPIPEDMQALLDKLK